MSHDVYPSTGKQQHINTNQAYREYDLVACHKAGNGHWVVFTTTSSTHNRWPDEWNPGDHSRRPSSTRKPLLQSRDSIREKCITVINLAAYRNKNRKYALYAFALIMNVRCEVMVDENTRAARANKCMRSIKTFSPPSTYTILVRRKKEERKTNHTCAT